MADTRHTPSTRPVVTAPRTVEAAVDGWDGDDERFFRLVAELFAPPFLFGAGVLLATYDVG